MITAEEQRLKREEIWRRMREWLDHNPQFKNWDFANARKDYTAYGYGHRPGEHIDMSNDKTIDGTCTEIPDPLLQIPATGNSGNKGEL